VLKVLKVLIMNKINLVLIALAMILFGCVGSQLGQQNATAGGAAVKIQESEIDLGRLSVPDVNVSTGSLGNMSGLDISSFSLPDFGEDISVNTTIGEIQVPSVDLAVPSLNLPGAGTTGTAPANATGATNATDASHGPTVDCSQFISVPSCSYVPESVRSMCEQCKK